MDTRGGNISSDYYIELGLKIRHQKPLTLKFFRGFMKRSPDFKVSKRCALEYQSAFSCDIMSGIENTPHFDRKVFFYYCSDSNGNISHYFGFRWIRIISEMVVGVIQEQPMMLQLLDDPTLLYSKSICSATL